MVSFRTIVITVVLGLILALNVSAAPSPSAQVQETVDKVLEMLRDQSMDVEVRRKALSKMLRARFDFTIMSQRTLGKYWKQGTEAEQQRFVELFSDLLEESYLGRLETYTDEKVSYTGARIKGDRAEVTTRIRSANLDVGINYRLVLSGEQWSVYDVIIEDVSMIKNYRSSYGEIVRNEGFAGLFSRMEAKLEELRRGSS